MDFFKVKRFRKAHKSNAENDLENKQELPPEEPKTLNGGDSLPKSTTADSGAEIEEDEDDDDFITNEVKRRLKELRRNSFMVLIPEEESYLEEEEETSSSEWRNEEAEVRAVPWRGFDSVYDKYCERMLFFDRVSAQQLHEAGSQNLSSPSPKSASKKLTSTFRNLSFKKREDFQDNGEHLQQHHLNEPYQDLETAYVAQICLTWEALHCQYTQLIQIILSQSENPTSYSHAAQQFQQFQVLLQRFIENEPFEQGSRVEIYVRTRNSLPKLLQVPNFQVSGQEEIEDLDSPILATDLIRVIESSILTFRLFLKTDKKKSGSILNMFGGHNQVASPLQQIQTSLDKKEMKLKELCRKKKGWKKKSWPATPEEVELLFGRIDIKVVSRVLRMERISKEQLLWCEEKMSKLVLSDSNFQRDGSPALFPC